MPRIKRPSEIEELFTIEEFKDGNTSDAPNIKITKESVAPPKKIFCAVFSDLILSTIIIV